MVAPFQKRDTNTHAYYLFSFIAYAWQMILSLYLFWFSHTHKCRVYCLANMNYYINFICPQQSTLIHSIDISIEVLYSHSRSLCFSQLYNLDATVEKYYLHLIHWTKMMVMIIININYCYALFFFSFIFNASLRHHWSVLAYFFLIFFPRFL